MLRDKPSVNQLATVSKALRHRLHENQPRSVISIVTARLVWISLAVSLYPALGADISKQLKDIENHYNSTQTLQLNFSETVLQQGRRRTESGDLFLRKPGRMRWDYSTPQGKLFVSDGKNVYYYSPETNRAERMKLKETEDMRAPMAFLLGRLDFAKDFKNYDAKPSENGRTTITAIPKSDKLPYKQVSFVVTPDNRIERLIVTGQDATVLDFTFSNEKVNPKLTDSLFQFKAPAGVEIVDTSEEAKR